MFIQCGNTHREFGVYIYMRIQAVRIFRGFNSFGFNEQAQGAF